MMPIAKKRGRTVFGVRIGLAEVAVSDRIDRSAVGGRLTATLSSAVVGKQYLW